MIVVDTSALIALTFDEPSAPDLRFRLGLDVQRVMSAASVVEFGTVVAGQLKIPAVEVANLVWDMLDDAGISVARIDEAQARMALEARVRFGKGFGAKAKLNFGDRFAYALAKSLDAPLLFVGDDFIHTGVTPALAANP